MMRLGLPMLPHVLHASQVSGVLSREGRLKMCAQTASLGLGVRKRLLQVFKAALNALAENGVIPSELALKVYVLIVRLGSGAQRLEPAAKPRVKTVCQALGVMSRVRQHSARAFAAILVSGAMSRVL